MKGRDVGSFVLAKDKEEVLRIPLSPEATPDELIWHYSKSKEFTVKSTYHHGMDFMYRDSFESTSTSATTSSSTTMWVALWNITIPPK